MALIPECQHSITDMLATSESEFENHKKGIRSTNYERPRMSFLAVGQTVRSFLPIFSSFIQLGTAVTAFFF